MERADTAPNDKRNKLILSIILVFSGIVLITSLLFIARINGWLGGKESVGLISLIDADNGADSAAYQTLTFIDDVHMVDSRCAADLEQMLNACREAGFDPRIDAAYRSESEQRELFNSIVEKYAADGCGNEEARALAAAEADPPGFSEHQLGLAVDISDRNGDGGITDWLRGNSWKFGFIQRYPQGKESVTGHPYVPAHFRYVGGETAKQINELGISLEEYVEMFFSN